MSQNKNLQPLAERMRPKQLKDFFGQEHLVKKNGILSLAIIQKQLPSLIFWGPPGAGKTTLANILASELSQEFIALSAINAGVKDIREVIEKAKNKHLFNASKPILFIDEIHRFNKGQQDALLAAVEKGIITLVGATTENPSFEINAALLSRCQVYLLNAHNETSLLKVLKHALNNDILLKEYAFNLISCKALINYSGGDARKALNLLEIVCNHLIAENKFEIDDATVKSIITKNPILFDKSGEAHYDTISAFIKSVRGSDPDAALIWLAKMLLGGEDPKFIARRLVILAAEDIGLANPTALMLANSTFEAVNKIGMPESRIILSECVIYLASSPKSNSAYLAIDEAIEFVKKTALTDVPLHLRNAPSQLMKDLTYGKNYQYPHDKKEGFASQNYFPQDFDTIVFYKPKANQREKQLEEYLKKCWPDRYE